MQGKQLTVDVPNSAKCFNGNVKFKANLWL